LHQPDGEENVSGAKRLAILPPDIAPQVEEIHCAVSADLPIAGQIRLNFALAVNLGQAIKHQRDNILIGLIKLGQQGLMNWGFPAMASVYTPPTSGTVSVVRDRARKLRKARVMAMPVKAKIACQRIYLPKSIASYQQNAQQPLNCCALYDRD
jgi:hypothetical protein